MVKFGETFQLVVSPQIILDVEEILEEWVVRLSEQENIDLERETMNMAQKIILFVAQQGENNAGM